MADGAEPTGVVYQLRVVLAGISPLIWRRLLVEADTSIAALHEILQTAFGWSDEHLHRFTIHGAEHGVWRDGGPGFTHDAHAMTLARFGLREGERFTYNYDFYDAWRHDIRVEKILTPNPARRYPVCTGGGRAAPPEDCGGPQAFLALRQEHDRWATTMRMAELAGLLLEAPPTATVREVLGEAIEELPALLYWAGIDRFDRAGCNRTLTTVFKKGTP